MFAGWPGIEVASAGLDHDAEERLSGDLLEWADIVFVMEKAQRRRLEQRFRAHLKQQRIVVLGIPDDYDYMDPALVDLLRRKVPPFLG